MAHALGAITPDHAEVDQHLMFAEAALSLAGHEVTDPALLAIIERAARHELTGDEAVAAIRRHIQG
ncbi:MULTISPECIES: antitoxin VbhA family protein [unclassified Rathayibacter]|uniref:antitoxin VbhA family protein n=1 Tax=unclassified Rathayibacter TaxID=2609250 RepID=UPI000F4CA0E9|nr:MULTISPECIES: antitoxin VbhA family protein [unclassified Rathayibacter]TDX81064.1 hypothetical protein EDF35_0730 [Rathayibacter sp. PhB151]